MKRYKSLFDEEIVSSDIPHNVRPENPMKKVQFDNEEDENDEEEKKKELLSELE